MFKLNNTDGREMFIILLNTILTVCLTVIFAANVNKQSCVAVNNSKFYADSCFVIHKTDKIYSEAKTSCTDFPNGHLAFVLTEKTVNAINQLFTAWWIAIGLEQVVRTQEPDGGWAWVHPDGRQWMIPDKRLILWETTAGEPNNMNNNDHTGCIVNYGLRDAGDGDPATYYLCEYGFWNAIGLEQVNRTQEPDGGWAWVHPDGRQWMIPDKELILWNTAAGEPNNNNNNDHVGYLVDDKLWDAGEGDPAAYYICEYERETKLYKLAMKDGIGHNVTFLAESTVADSIGCGKKCSQVLICRAFSYKQSDHHCILHSTTSDGISALSPEQREGYDMYNSRY